MKEINFIAPRTFKNILTPPPPQKKVENAEVVDYFLEKKLKI